ncbi:peptide transporter family 1-like [Arctopsyche grandis]|uniref:peptide transporter family 1-like n=1 Tax=Arctopsyche grandis TaxID=121162 RepID=UPI00406D93C2
MLNKKMENEVVHIDSKKSDKFPRPVILIVLNEFCERFSYSGMRAFLALYLRQKLFYTDDEATEVYHIFTTMAYFFPICGAILADSYLGKFRTILYLMMVYACGNFLLAITAIPTLGIPGREFTILGLMLVSLGTGGIKPCVSAFGGDQFKLPEQEKQLTTFFSVFYIIICLGSLVSKSISPILRSEIHCFGDKDCYSVAFGAPGILILSSIVMFVCAKKMYIIKTPKSNVVLNVMKCITRAIKNKFASKNSEKKKNHWLDYAKDTYDDVLINETKQVLRIFILFMPLAVYWSLLDQLGSRWTLQATKMDGNFGLFTAKPDQMQVMSPVLVILFVALFKKGLYPCLEKCGIEFNSLHKLIVGSLLAGVAFICSGCLEMNLEKTYPILPSTEFGQLRIFNGYDCDLEYSNRWTNESFKIAPLDFYVNKFISVEGNRSLMYDKIISCQNSTTNSIEQITIEEKKAISYFHSDFDEGKPTRYEDNIAKSRSGYPHIRILANVDKSDLNISLYNIRRQQLEVVTNATVTKLFEVFSGGYDLYVNSQHVPLEIDLNIGGVYTLMILKENYTFNANLIAVTKPNSVSMLWLGPQLVIISASEVLFAITGMEFAFKEAPESMKSVLQAYWYLVEAVGNIIIILVTRLGSGYRQVTQFFFFAFLVFLATILFYFLTKRHERLKANDAKYNGGPIRYELVMQNDKIQNQL